MLEQTRPTSPQPLHKAQLPLKSVWTHFISVWAWLTEPTRPIANEEERSRYRILAGTHVTMMLSIVILFTLNAARNPIENWIRDVDTISASIGTVIVFGLYLLLRRTQRITPIAIVRIALVTFVAAVSPFFPESRDTVLLFDLTETDGAYGRIIAAKQPSESAHAGRGSTPYSPGTAEPGLERDEIHPGRQQSACMSIQTAVPIAMVANGLPRPETSHFQITTC